MITFLGLSFRYLELGVAAAAVVVTGLIFLRRRAPALVWISAAAMSVLAVHLFLEEGRWQMVPLYAIVFSFSIWLAVPSDGPYRGGGMLFRIVVVVLLLIPALALPAMVPIFVVPAPSGPHAVGVATIEAEAGSVGGAVTIHYPLANADGPDSAAAVNAPYWSLADVNSYRLPGLPGIASTHLTLVPTNSILRGPREEGAFPVAVALPSPASLPSDFLVLEEQLASLGWLVVRTRPGARADEVIALLGKLGSGGFDRGFDGAGDVDRAVILSLGWDAGLDLGLPVIQVGGEDLIRVVNAGGRYGISLPDSRIPPDAITNRSLIVRPSRLLVGSSDVSPTRLRELIVRATSALLGDGSYSSPVFAGGSAQPALADAQQALSGEVPGILVRPR